MGLLIFFGLTRNIFIQKENQQNRYFFCLQNLKLLFRFQFSEKMWLFVIYLCVLFISTATMLGEGIIFKNVLIIGPCLDQISPVVSQEKICLYFTDHDDRLHMMVKAHMALAGELKRY